MVISTELKADLERMLLAKPRSVAILGMGASIQEFVLLRLGQRVAYDEYWGINSVAGVLRLNRVFSMADLQYSKQVNPELGEWLRVCGVPIYTCKEYPEDFPTSVEYPLEAVLKRINLPYLNNSVAYAVALALCMDVKEIGLFGCDFTYKDVPAAEAGRACVEFWLGVAAAKGTIINVGATTSMMDANDRMLYGYKLRPDQLTSIFRWDRVEASIESTTMRPGAPATQMQSKEGVLDLIEKLAEKQAPAVVGERVEERPWETVAAQ